MEKNKGRNNSQKNVRKKKRMSYKKRIQTIQIGAITFAVFLTLIVGAQILTSRLVGEPDNSNMASTADQALDEAAVTDVPDDNSSQTAVSTTTPEAVESEQIDHAEATPTGEAESSEPAEEVQITISATGNCTIGGDESFSTANNFDAFYIVKKDLGYFFQNVKDIFAADDLTIINMEGTLTEVNTRQEKTYAFKGSPKYAQVLSLGNVDVANLGNDHSKDYGEQSYADTIQNLESEGIVAFGNERVAVMDIKGIKIGLVGINETASGLECQTELIANINQAIEQGSEAVIVSFHWGDLESTVPDDVQKELAHIAIDNGADLVLGHHPKTLQGIEKYNGKNIVYSLGNFCYGGEFMPTDKDTMIYQQTFTFHDGVLVEDDVTNIIPCKMSSLDEYNDYQPTPAEGTEADRILQKINEQSAALAS